jgi:hypothetical protein
MLAMIHFVFTILFYFNVDDACPKHQFLDIGEKEL